VLLMPIAPWVGVDLDGTLAIYDGWEGPEVIGPPVPAMLKLVKDLLKRGRKVKIFTARVTTDGTPERAEEARKAMFAIEAWCERHIGQRLEITNVKDFGMAILYDDRCRQVEVNTGRIIGEDE
jgi:hypothetical protein